MAIQCQQCQQHRFLSDLAATISARPTTMSSAPSRVSLVLLDISLFAGETSAAETDVTQPLCADFSTPQAPGVMWIALK